MKEMQECIQRETEMLNSICERYFDRMYNNIGFTLTFYGVIIAAGLNAHILERQLEAKIVLMYLLPSGTYILGILFCNNVLQVEKTGYVQLTNELKMKLLFLSNDKKFSIEGWVQSAKTNGSASILAYGCVFTAYVVSPLLSIVCYCILHCTSSAGADLMTFSNLIPFGFYVIYLLVLTAFVFQIFGMRSKNRKVQIEGIINGVLVRTHPKYDMHKKHDF